MHRTGIVVALRVLLGLVACAWTAFASFAGSLLGGLGAPDAVIVLLVGGALADIGAIVALFLRPAWGALLVVAQLAGVLVVSVILTGHAPTDAFLVSAMIATTLLAVIVAWMA